METSLLVTLPFELTGFCDKREHLKWLEKDKHQNYLSV